MMCFCWIGRHDVFRWEKVVSPLRCNAVRDRISTSSSPIGVFRSFSWSSVLCTSRAMMMHDFSSSSHCIPHKIQTSPAGHYPKLLLLQHPTPFKKDDSTVPALLIPTLYDAIGDALLLYYIHWIDGKRIWLFTISARLVFGKFNFLCFTVLENCWSRLLSSIFHGQLVWPRQR